MIKFFEDLRVGERVPLGSYLFTAEDIKTFAGQYDPQRFHVDEEEGRESHFGGLIASGWHTGSIWMRKMVDHNKARIDELRQRGERIPITGPSPGFRDMRWHKPVFAGDTVSYAFEVIDMRPSKSRPEFGLVHIRASGDNQHGERVITFVSTTFVERRSPSAE